MKTYLYIPSGAPGATTVTEDWVRAQIRKWPAYAAHGQQVLDLEVDQDVAFPSGAHYRRLADNHEPFRAVICGGRTTKRCTHISYSNKCNATAPYLCDFPTPGRKSTTCDAPRCEAHRRRVGPDLDYCITHPHGEAACAP